MKLARSTTFNPEKIFSSFIIIVPLFVLLIPMRFALWSASVELCRPLLEEGCCALLFVLCSGAKSEERSLECQALVLACFESFVHRFERVLDRNGSVGKDLLED